jgi:hypothetical protein
MRATLKGSPPDKRVASTTVWSPTSRPRPQKPGTTGFIATMGVLDGKVDRSTARENADV